MLYRYGLKLGFKLLLHRKFKQSLPYLIKPVNYWRTVEFMTVLAEGYFRSNDKILDIGSPKLLSIYLADKIGAEVFSTDIEDYFVRRLHLIRKIQRVPLQKLHIKVEDGRNLHFKDNYFNKVYSISVLEHIPDCGDSLCSKEVGRVLAKKGRAIITVPFAPRSRTEYKAENFYWAKSSSKGENGKIFYQRRYSEEDLYTRIIHPSGLILKKLGYIGENVLTGSDKELGDFLPAVTGPVQPVLSRIFHTNLVSSWEQLKKPLCAVIVLEKE